LDKKQTGREKGYTPIEQAYLYATKFDRCNWIIVSNFREIRLYNKNRTQDHFEKFDVLELHKGEEFKRFFYILCKTNLISKLHASVIDDLANDTALVNEDITGKFYNQYKTARLDLFLHLIENNSTSDQTVLLEKAQKIIDRFIFILFCEDTGNLLPRNLVKETYELGVRSRERSDERVWREFKNLFMDIDIGRSDIDPKINKYNGGLFANDEDLNNLTIKDAIWQSLIKLNTYDFESEVDVNILGHIFEQSISDLETLKTKIPITSENQEILTSVTGEIIVSVQEELSIVEKQGRRKKEGIFYTPDFVTQYLVEIVVGRFLEENPDKLESIRILDPACGSGAFLNQAHSYLMRGVSV
jgi:type I restriction-modification system DNA methylase subunit